MQNSGELVRARQIKILLSEGSSLSARQTITALGLAGYRVDLCTSDALCIGAFSRYVKRVHKVPAAADNPEAYMATLLDVLKNDTYDVLLPTHEQAFLFAAHREQLRQHTHIALAPFTSFLQVQSKTASARLFKKLNLPQPNFEVVLNSKQKPVWDSFPAYAKLAYGTAGQSVWRVGSANELEQLLEEITWEAPNELLLQAEASAKLLCQAQAIFSEGKLVALHCTQQHAVGIGSSQSARLSVHHMEVRPHLDALGQELRWHGPLTVDYLYDPQAGPQYIEVNPRLVEPMNATYSGLNLAALTVELSLTRKLSPQPLGKAGVVSSSLLATALGIADRTGSRWQVLVAAYEAMTHRGIFKESREDLTPISDPRSLFPLFFVLSQILLQPSKAQYVAAKSIGRYSLPAAAIRRVIEDRKVSS